MPVLAMAQLTLYISV